MVIGVFSVDSESWSLDTSAAITREDQILDPLGTAVGWKEIWGYDINWFYDVMHF